MNFLTSVKEKAVKVVKKAVSFVEDCAATIATAAGVGYLAAHEFFNQGVSAQTTPTIYDPGVDISGMTGVAADGLGDVVGTALAVAFGFLVIGFGFAWVKKTMRSK